MGPLDLLTRPNFAANVPAAGIGPDPLPIVATGAVDREAGLAAGAVRHRKALVAADPGSDEGLAADVPGHPKRLAGALDRDG